MESLDGDRITATICLINGHHQHTDDPQGNEVALEVRFIIHYTYSIRTNRKFTDNAASETQHWLWKPPSIGVFLCSHMKAAFDVHPA